jgi:hypothetical protein
MMPEGTHIMTSRLVDIALFVHRPNEEGHDVVQIGIVGLEGYVMVPRG